MIMKEKEIEEKLISKLRDLKYVYRQDIKNKASLEENFRQKFDALNRVTLTDAEFGRLCRDIISRDVFTASKTLREKNTFSREDGTPLNYTLVNLDNWCKNEFEVINQLSINTEYSRHRYDVIVLINGIPVVQVELKGLQISPRRAMQQIVDYKDDPGNGYTNSLLCFMQLFIISNRTNTYYFANNRDEDFKFDAEEQFLPVYQHADVNNEKITHLDPFADTFLEKCHIGKMLSRYMVLVASTKRILVMRPYQIHAVRAILDCIHENRGNGYIWHTTGSGKTLTSFKAATLLKNNADIYKCLFVVDRKDLDRQTRDEFNRFQQGCVEQNVNTRTLVRRLLSGDYADKVIVTTIQKLGLALDENSRHNKAQAKRGRETHKDRLEPLRDKRMVFIFDECHRSQFGETHQAIKRFFPNAQFFGFTGTPIFKENATYKKIDGTVATYNTTEDIFEKELHAYTITHAIEDKNVLSFHVDYFDERKGDGSNIKNRNKEARANAVVREILGKHNAATNQRQFNAILATASINDAIQYFTLFKERQAESKGQDENFQPLNVACVFSPPAEGDKDVQQLQEDLAREKEDNKDEPEKKKAALVSIIGDYNKQYRTSHKITEFDSYYQDVQQRIKDQEYPNKDYSHKNKIDIVIVVDMLLTGFDSQYLNTLYVDKNLKYHGLIQALSRTNRVLNATKPWGNILDFRDQGEDLDAAIELFSGKADDRDGAREIWLVDPAPKLIRELEDSVAGLRTFMQGEGLDYAPEEVSNLKGDRARSEFINRFKEVQRLKTQLGQYTDLDDSQEQEIEDIIPGDTQRAFKVMYLDTAQRLKIKQDRDDDNTIDDVRQLDFEFVLFASALVDYDYIMKLIADSTQPAGRETMTREELVNRIRAQSNLMGEQDDIIAYINHLPAKKVLNEEEIRDGYQAFKARNHAAALAGIARKHGLSPESLQEFVDTILDRMIFDGEKLTDLMAPLELRWKQRLEKELALMKALIPLLHKRAEGQEISGLSVYEAEVAT